MSSETRVPRLLMRLLAMCLLVAACNPGRDFPYKWFERQPSESSHIILEAEPRFLWDANGNQVAENPQVQPNGEFLVNIGGTTFKGSLNSSYLVSPDSLAFYSQEPIEAACPRGEIKGFELTSAQGLWVLTAGGDLSGLLLLPGGAFKMTPVEEGSGTYKTALVFRSDSNIGKCLGMDEAKPVPYIALAFAAAELSFLYPLAVPLTITPR